MNHAQLSRTLLDTVRCAVDDGELCVSVPERVMVQTPPRHGRGDYATNVALRLAGEADLPARDIAEALRTRLVREAGIAHVEVAGPGFLNITVADEARSRVVAQLIAEQRVSAPTGGRTGAAERSVDGQGPGDRECGRVPSVGNPLRDAERWAAATGVLGAEGSCGSGAGAVGGTPVRQTGNKSTGAAGATAIAGAVNGASPAVGARAAGLSGADGVGNYYGAGTAGAGAVPGELLVQRESNPLFRVQYAHARIRALLRNARDLGFDPDPDEAAYDEPTEAALLALLADHARVAVTADGPRMARHLESVAEGFFRFHDALPLLPRGDEKPGAAHRARMALAEATGAVLAGGLTRLGISAPEHL